MRHTRRGVALCCVMALALVAVAPAAAAGAAGVVQPSASSGGPSAGAASVAAPSATAPTSAQSTPREDPDSDRLGWEAGYWHDDPVDVTPSDGLSADEIDRIVRRAMARVEVIRGQEFTDRVPVTVLTREQYREEVANGSEPSPAQRLHQNVKLEALYFVGEDADAYATLESSTAASVLGYYAPGAERIVVVSEDESEPTIDELTLGHELVHALQDQRFAAFNRPWYPGETTEANLAVKGVIEGDANYVQHRYRQRCGAEWDCIEPERTGSSGAPPHMGWSVLQYAPYSDGAAFVAQRHESGGWSAVNDLYEHPTRSTEQFIHPQRYPDDEPRNVTVTDRAVGEWQVLDLEGPTDHAVLGEAGVFSMLWYPSHVNGGRTVVVPYDIFGEPAPDALDYSHPASAGWDGDRLVPYVNATPGTTNETGYVWRLAWDSPADAAEFADAYREVLAFYGGEVVARDDAAHTSTHRLDDSRGFADAVHVNVSGDVVTVTNAPTVAALSAIRPGITVGAETTSTSHPTATTVASGSATTSAASSTRGGAGTPTDRDPQTTARRGGGPVGGPPGLAAVLALAIALALAAGTRLVGGDRS